MRPYLAIIRDSFQSALASRVLYILLGIIVLLLLVIAPLHIRESLDTEISVIRDIENPHVVADRLIELQADGQPAAKRIWEALPESLRKELQREVDVEGSTVDTEAPGPPQMWPVYVSLAEQLNTLINDPDFYQAEDWTTFRLGREADELIESGVENLSQIKSARLNRILIGIALSPTIRAGSRTAIDVWYANWEWSFLSTNQTHQQFASIVTSTVPYIFDKFVLSIGLIIAILVTANIIPETFEPGSLNLLLSKPISRSGLFLAKFFGGCALITLCSTLLFVGLWLWMGLALQVWERSILLSIPLYIVVFAIYYSVSALVGLMFRSTILSVIATAIFWLVCFSVGSIYGFLNTKMENSEFTRVVATDQGVVAADRLTMLYRWNENDTQWTSASESGLKGQDEMAIGTAMYFGELDGLPEPLGPILDTDTGLTLAGRMIFKSQGFSAQRDLMVSDGGAFRKRGSLPNNAQALLASTDGPLVVTGNGEFFRIDAKALADNSPESQGPPEFKSIGPDQRVSFRSGSSVALNPVDQRLAIYGRGTLATFGMNDDGVYTRENEFDIETGFRSSMSCRIAFGGDLIVLAFGNGRVILIDAATGDERKSWPATDSQPVTQIATRPDGQMFALVYRDETLRMLNTDAKPTLTRAAIRGQGSISSVSFTDKEKLIVADRTDRVTTYNLPALSHEKILSPSGDWVAQSFRYAVAPLYRVFPKPGEFYKVVTHLAQSADASENPDLDLTTEPARQNPWSPLVSGLAFMAGMLALSCWIFSRRDH